MITFDFDLDPPADPTRNSYRPIDSSSPGEYFPNSPVVEHRVVSVAAAEGDSEGTKGERERQTL